MEFKIKIALINLITQTIMTPNILSLLRSNRTNRDFAQIKQLETDKDVMIIELGRALVQQGHEVTIYISDIFKPKKVVSMSGLSIKYLHTSLKWLSPPFVIPFTPELFFELRKNDFDVIQSTDILQWGTILASMSTVGGRRTPLVIWQGLDEIKSPIWDLINRLYNATFGVIVGKKINIFIAKSNNSITFLKKSGIHYSKIRGVVPVGVSTTVFHPMDGLPIRKQIGIKPGVPLILCVARLHPNKRIDCLIRAMNYVVKKEPNAFLIIKGDGPSRVNLEKLITKLGLSENICISTPAVSREKMTSLYAACDFTVLPSIIEPFGFVVVESMACGKPMVASNIGGPRDILRNSNAGILVQPENPEELAVKILFMIQNPKIREIMSTAALQVVNERYEWGTVAKKFIEVYKIAQISSKK